MAYATGKHAYGVCDICGQRYKYRNLRKNWKGLMVCGADYEPKEPQLFPLNYTADAVSLRDARPDRREPLVVLVGSRNDTIFTSVGMQPAPVAKPLKATASVGNVTVDIS
jgi:hypothetical protein